MSIRRIVSPVKQIFDLTLFSSIFFLDENAACIGICYHNKLKSLEDGGGNYSKGWPLNSKEFGPPCVGLCYMYREKNMDNPGDKFQHTGVTPTMTPTITPTSF